MGLEVLMELEEVVFLNTSEFIVLRPSTVPLSVTGSAAVPVAAITTPPPFLTGDGMLCVLASSFFVSTHCSCHHSYNFFLIMFRTVDFTNPNPKACQMDIMGFVLVLQPRNGFFTFHWHNGKYRL